jgi:uncharacterized protein (TIGR02266 family)
MPERENRRRWPRVALELAVVVKFASVDDAVASRTVDLSRGGVFIQMAEPRPMGTLVSMSVQIGEGREIAVSGVVVRSVRPEDLSGPPGVAVVFTNVEEPAKSALEGLLAEKLARSKATVP